jgi:hypothetical protein
MSETDLRFSDKFMASLLQVKVGGTLEPSHRIRAKNIRNSQNLRNIKNISNSLEINIKRKNTEKILQLLTHQSCDDYLTFNIFTKR